MHGKMFSRTAGGAGSRHCLHSLLFGSVLALTLVGCSFSLVDLTPHTYKIQRFELPTPKLTPVKNAWCRSLVLRVEPFTIPDKYDTRFYTRIGSHEALTSNTAQWVESPGLMLTDLLHASLLQCGLFRHVTGARSGIPADLRLAGSILVFEKQRSSRRAPASSMRSFRECEEKPPKTTEWMAPMRAQACIATMASGVIGR